MPKLRPLRTQEEISKVPMTEEVLIELTKDDGSVNVDVTAGSTAVAQIEKPDTGDDRDEQIASFKKQLDEMKTAREAEKTRAERAEREREEALRRAAEREQEVTRHQTRAEDAEFDAINNAVAAAKTEGDSASRDLEQALTNADTKAVSDAQRRLARAEARLMSLEDGKAAFEERRASQKDTQKRQATTSTDPVEAMVNSMQHLSAAERSWIMSHPETMSEPRKNATLQKAYWDATDAGFSRGSKEYFQFLDEALGYKKKEVPPKKDDTDDEEPIVSAPVSRDNTSAGSGKVETNRITLTPAQREAARTSGVDEVTYAKQLIRMNQMKKEGYFDGR